MSAAGPTSSGYPEDSPQWPADLAGPRCSECRGWHFGRPCPPAAPEVRVKPPAERPLVEGQGATPWTFSQFVVALSPNSQHLVRTTLHHAMVATPNELVQFVLALACLDIPVDPDLGPCQACLATVKPRAVVSLERPR